MIQLQNISKTYNTKDGKSQTVFSSASANIPEGEVSFIIGASGSGKSTLLNILGTVDTPDSGEIIYGGMETRLSGISKPSEFRNLNIGFIFQSHNLLPEFTVAENIYLPAMIKGTSKPDYIDEANKLLNVCGITELKDKYPNQISGGEAQRAAICRALINNPGLVLADEPTGNLDKENSKIILDLLLSLSKEKEVTTIMATHAFQMTDNADNVYVVESEKIGRK
jgi:lipoprotein-releasing system ATP-binding protein